MLRPLLCLAWMLVGLSMTLPGWAQLDSEQLPVGELVFAEHDLVQVAPEELALHNSDQAAFVSASADYVAGNDRSAIEQLTDYLAGHPDDLLALRMLTDLYVRNDQHQRALALLADNTELVARDSNLSITLVQLNINAGHVNVARQQLAGLSTSSIDKELLATLEAELHLALGEPEYALAKLPRRDYRTLPMSYGLLRGVALMQLGKLPEAAQAAGELSAAYPDGVEVHNFAALVYLHQQQDDAAQGAIDAALALDPTDLEARFNQAVLLSLREQPQQAERILDGVLADAPGHERALLLKATVLHQQGKGEEALRWSERIYNHDISSPVPDEFQLQLYIDNGQWPEALRAVERLALAHPDNASYRQTQADIYIALGDEARQQGQSEQAQSWYMKSYQLNPDNAPAIVRLYELGLQGVGAEAFIEAMETALQETTLAPWVVRLLADSYLAQGRSQTAAQYYEALLTHPEYREDADILNNLANAYASQDLDRALTLARQALAAEQIPSPEVLDTLGWIHVLRREYEQALVQLRRAHQLNGSDPGIRYHLALALNGLGRTSEARSELRLALEQGEDFADRSDARQLLNRLAE